MVIRIHSTKDTYGPISYNFDKVDEGVADILAVDNCIDGRNVRDNVETSFYSYIRKNSRIEKPVFTVSLNPSLEDLEKLTDEDLLKIARDYMQQMGYEDQPAVYIKHRDIDRIHLHIVSIRVDEFGNKINSNFEKGKSSKVRRELEVKYNLTRAEQVRRKDKAITENRYINNQRQLLTDKLGVGERDYITSLRKVLRYVHQYNISDFQSYNRILSIMGVQCEEVEGAHKGLVYYIIDKDGNRISPSVKGSKIAKEFGYPHVQKFIEQNSKNEYKIKNKKNSRKSTKSVVDRVLKYNSDYKSFKEVLQANGIYIYESRGEGGKIFGLTFIDTINGEIYKGSELGKQYSANNILAQLTPEGMGVKANKDDKKEILKILSSIYKEEKIAYKNEINYIDQIENHRALFIDKTIKAKPNIIASDILSAVDFFIKSKTDYKEKLLEKERKYFNRKVEFAKTYIPLVDEQLQIDMLYSLGLTLKMDNDHLVVSDNSDHNFSYSAQQIGLDLTNIEATRPERIRYFSQKDMQLYHDILFGDVSKVHFDKYNPYSLVFRYLPKTKADMAKRKMLIDTIEDIASSGSLQDKINDLLNRGFIIRPYKDKNGIISYKVGHYRQTVDSYVAVSSNIAQQLTSINYRDNIYPNVRTLLDKTIYDYIVDITLAYDLQGKEKDYQLKHIVNNISKKDKQLGKQVEELIEKGVGKDKIIHTLYNNDLYKGEKEKKNKGKKL